MRVLDTERLILRWLDAPDAGFMLELLNDPDWLGFIGDRGVRTVDDARRYIASGPRELYARLGFGLYLVELKESGASIGICGLIKRDWLDDVDLGFAFLPQGRGRGYAYEAAAAAVRYGQSILGLARIAAIVAPENRDSLRLLARLGFRFERTVRPPGETKDLRLMALASRSTERRPPAPVTIRRATPGHLPDILRMLSVQLLEHHVVITAADVGEAIRGAFEDSTRGFCLVLELGGHCIGVAYVSFIWALEHGGRSAWLEEIYVEPPHRGAGLGNELLKAVVAECSARGCAALDLEIDADHERVRTLYERHGFASLPRRRLVKRLSDA